MADDAAKKGDETKSGEFTTTAETIATRLIEIEREVEDLKALHLDNSRAVEQAKSAVEQNSIALQEKLTERNKLLGQLDQAKMQEQMNSAMAQLSETVGQDVPTFNEVREKIEARYAKATGMAELSEGSVESRMLEVERATRSTEAHARLDAMREQMGLTTGEPEPAAVEAEEPTPEA
jgi:phage shock protein A